MPLQAQAETKPATGLSSDDKEFLAKAAQGGMTEVALGKLAAQKGTTSQIRDFGKMMVTDHEKINNDVKALAKSKNVALPAALDEKHQGKVDALGKLSGKAFDDAYLDAMSKMHEKDLAAFTEARDKTKDADLKAVLDKAIPVVKSHLEHLKSILSKS